MKKLILISQIIFFLGLLLYSLFIFGWHASNLMLRDDWKSLLVFNKNAINPQDISEIDKLIYGFHHTSILSLFSMFFSFFYVLTLIIILIKIVSLNKKDKFYK
ncbi:DUF4306 domain-containing protein [Falsibacillus pallidus]|uniref:Uncharacterized protein DUF4306 n=1 Tax=Falsibacillus pallidus TaxID=493781 RepID=A0A370GB13_9BACI|nr:DUF4306 domain-containing protein [Falsibacillus pallidus]RDI40921.1 uncharacterized protein DUF4306 [Falsibacillus pallidus]